MCTYYIQLGLNDDMRGVDLFSTVLMLDVCFERRAFFWGPFQASNEILFIFSPLPIVLYEQDAFFACIGGRRDGFDAFCATCLPLADKVCLAACLLVV